MRRELDAPLSSEVVRRIYDRIGSRYDLLQFAERAPQRWALERLAVQPGERVLEAGCGTGTVLIELARAARPALPLDTPNVGGLDASPRMLVVARQRIQAAGLANVVSLQSGSILALPYPDASFDAIFSSYVLDLLPSSAIPVALGEMKRVLKPSGRAALVALSPGVSPLARAFTSAYEALYRRHPGWLAGCRPIALASHVAAGFTLLACRAWFRGHPSEAALARNDTPHS